MIITYQTDGGHEVKQPLRDFIKDYCDDHSHDGALETVNARAANVAELVGRLIEVLVERQVLKLNDMKKLMPSCPEIIR